MDEVQRIVLKIISTISRYWSALTSLRIRRRIILLFVMAFLLPILITILFLAVLPSTSISAGRGSTVNPVDTASVKRSRPSKEEKAAYKAACQMDLRNAFIRSRLEMVKNDSVNLIINLNDSILGLDIKGVIVMEIKIEDFRICQGFRKLNPELFIQRLATPSILSERSASIPLYPIVIKQAPKDTAEANMAPAEIPEHRNEDVYVTLKFDKDLFVYLEQSEPNTYNNSRERKSYFRHKRRDLFREAISSVFRFSAPQYNYWIKLKISRDDAKSIYRALPDEAMMAIYFSLEAL